MQVTWVLLEEAPTALRKCGSRILQVVATSHIGTVINRGFTGGSMLNNKQGDLA